MFWLSRIPDHAAVNETVESAKHQGFGQQAGGTKAPDDQSTSLESLVQTKVVTASRFSQGLQDAPGVMKVVSREDVLFGKDKEK